MNMSATGEQWRPFTPRQRVLTRKPGFLWEAEVPMSPGLPAHVEDRYTASNATLIDGPVTLTLLFRFNDAGLIASVRADARGAGAGKDGVMVMLPWDCALSDDKPQGGMPIPMTGEAACVRPEGRKGYFVGHVKPLSHELLP